MRSARSRPSVLLVGCSALLFAAASLADSAREQRLQSVLTDFLQERPTVPGIMVRLKSDAVALDWMGAAGVADRESGRPIRPDQPARLASTTKTYVAAAVLRLAEEGHLKPDDPISRHLSKPLDELLRADGYRTDEITVSHLLTHTGGIASHLVDAFLDALVTDPMRDWSAEGIIAFMTRVTDPLGPPGTRFLYSDGGYILLGDILRQATGRSIGAAVRWLLRFEELGLQATWWEVMEPEPAGVEPRVSQYFFDANTRDWNPSFDLYGGGGLVATMPEVARFYESLFAGRVFSDPATLRTMLTPVIPERGGPLSDMLGLGASQYCHGIFASEHAGYTIFSHLGAWGTAGGYVPGLDLSFGISISVLDTEALTTELLLRLVDVLVE